MEQIIPKEYYLESPAKYDDFHTKSQFTSLADIYGIQKLAESTVPVISLFTEQEHQEIANDILIYLVDTETYDVFDKANQEKFIKRYILSLFEAGFFG